MNKQIRVLMQIRDNYLSNSGGDTIQLLKTRDYLEKRGIYVDISTNLEPDLSDYDAVHLFNLTRIQETYFQMKNAVRQNKPIALSTIYWPYSEINKKGFEGIQKLVYRIFRTDNIERIKALYKYLFRKERNKGCKALILGSYTKMQNEVLESADICLPNGKGEMDKIADVLKIYQKDYIVVPNAVDMENVLYALQDDCEKYKEYQGAIICVARISRRKNQLLLVEALKGTDYKLIFVGKESPGEMKYYKKFIKAIEDNPNITYIKNIPNQELYHLYKYCKVSVLPSWFETPGLVSLEAGVMGCNVVITDKGTTREYFDKYAFYCDIEDLQSIRAAVEAAYNSPFDSGLRERIMTRYTWEEAAYQTELGYRKIIPTS